MSDKLPTREEAKNHANMFRCYVSGSGKAAYDVLTSYADGLLQPTHCDNCIEVCKATHKREECLLQKPVVDREKLINLIEISDSFWEHRIEDLADLILAEVNGGD
jgi:epoxyqueuosine reductase QueG